MRRAKTQTGPIMGGLPALIRNFQVSIFINKEFK